MYITRRRHEPLPVGKLRADTLRAVIELAKTFGAQLPSASVEEHLPA